MARVAARDAARAERESERAYNAAVRRVEQARKADERAAAQLARATEAERKRLAKESQEAHVESMEAEAERLNLDLERQYEEIDSLLIATLSVDDYVDLNTLRKVVSHPPFPRRDLELATAPPAEFVDPPKPQLALPPEPTGLRSIFGRGAHAKAVAAAQQNHARAESEWQSAIERLAASRAAAQERYTAQEAMRKSALEAARERYAAECAEREAAVRKHNESIDSLVANLGYGAIEAVHEYLSIVLSNSVYPAHFPVEHNFTFNPATAELKLRAIVPPPDKLPTIKAHKYSKSADEITTTALSAKACKDRYAGAVQQVALRTLHEVFEADRRGLIRSIALEVGTDAFQPATGRDAFIMFVAVGAERSSFLELDLGRVVPAATLTHLGAAVSKNPYDLVAADSSGIRRS
jgi:restriction system protein